MLQTIKTFVKYNIDPIIYDLEQPTKKSYKNAVIAMSILDKHRFDFFKLNNYCIPQDSLANKRVQAFLLIAGYLTYNKEKDDSLKRLCKDDNIERLKIVHEVIHTLNDDFEILIKLTPDEINEMGKIMVDYAKEIYPM